MSYFFPISLKGTHSPDSFSPSCPSSLQPWQCWAQSLNVPFSELCLHHAEMVATIHCVCGFLMLWVRHVSTAIEGPACKQATTQLSPPWEHIWYRHLLSVHRSEWVKSPQSSCTPPSFPNSRKAVPVQRAAPTTIPGQFPVVPQTSWHCPLNISLRSWSGWFTNEQWWNLNK